MGGAEFADRVMAGLSGEKGVTECTFVESSITEAKYFASLVTLGKEGVETIHDIGTVNEHEKKLLADMMPDLLAQAEKGIKWAAENKWASADQRGRGGQPLPLAKQMSTQ